jgi:hypothetical protein
MGFVIVLKSNPRKRAREVDGSLTPYFEHKAQAINYISKRLGNSEYVKEKEV